MERVGVVLRDLQGQGTLRQRLAHARAIEKWPELVGAPLADRTRPVRVADGRLFVVAKGAALRQELTFHQRTILRKFNEAAGGRVVREVVFLESDALDYEERPVSPFRRKREAHPEQEQEPPPSTSAEPEAWEDKGAMYDSFDAAAYRRQLERIAGNEQET